MILSLPNMRQRVLKDFHFRCSHSKSSRLAGFARDLRSGQARGDDYVSALKESDWPAYFVKDFVKSLTTKRGSRADAPEDIGAIISQIEHYRGGIEGGICVRRWEDYVQGTERRFFVMGGKPFSADAETVPGAVSVAAQRIASPFFSVDVAERRDGTVRIIEIGDGQVSDRKHWPVQRFVDMLASV